jgi:hypothetical protein
MAGIFVLIVGLCIYSVIRSSEFEPGLPRLERYLQNPEKYDGQELIFTHDVVQQVTNTGFYFLADSRKVLFAEGKINGIKKGDVFSGRVSFHKNGQLKIEEIHIHKGDKWRKIVSVPPMLIVIILFFIQYKIIPKKLLFVERK